MTNLNIDDKFKKFIVLDRNHPNPMFGGDQWVFKFPNNFGASLITGGYGEYEIGVVEFDDDSDEFSLTYDTPITDDVLGYLDLKKVEEHLDQIKKLKKRKTK